MLKSSLCYYILVSGTITIEPQEGDNPNNNDKEVVFKHFAPFTGCISKIHNTQIDNTKETDVVMPNYNVMEYSDNYSKTSGVLWQHYWDEPALTTASAVAIFSAANNSASFKFKQKVACKTPDNGAKNDERAIKIFK